jgi:hypothetical protein
MVFLFRLILVAGSLFGAAVCFLSNITVNSSVGFFNEISGTELSIIVGMFFFMVFVNGLFSMFTRNS